MTLQFHLKFLHQIISLALNLATSNSLFGSYFIVAGLEYLHVEQTNDDDEILRAEFRDMVNAGVAPSVDIDYLLNDFTNLLNGFRWESESTEEGASTSTIDENKLVKNGGFVASSSQERQGFDVGFTCSVCLEGPQAGDKLIRMNCSHIYHQSCLLPWLQKHNTCPNCRCKLDEQ
ncbi:e3 ubiquitin-protein ligase ring1-like [Quercus suber]|uniref:E3 ubiquitin-protein ligase ring1-like n=1 Tax=Quercus suber TaxID=58331 RepID=A0AAW0M257_QUESU